MSARVTKLTISIEDLEAMLAWWNEAGCPSDTLVLTIRDGKVVEYGTP